MARAYSEDLRERVLAAAAGGTSARSAAARFGVAVATAVRWVARARDGERDARRQGRPRGSQLDAHGVFVTAMIEAKKDVTLNEMVERLAGRARRLHQPLGVERLASPAGLDVQKRPRTHWSRSAPTS